jgi:hypothetical protein
MTGLRFEPGLWLSRAASTPRVTARESSLLSGCEKRRRSEPDLDREPLIHAVFDRGYRRDSRRLATTRAHSSGVDLHLGAGGWMRFSAE